MNSPESIQKEYYARTANVYDSLHVQGKPESEHEFALAYLSAIITHLQIKSVLDVGAGTGRTLAYLQQIHPSLTILGVEPVAELRAIGHQKGIETAILVDGDGKNLAFDDQSFDLVCEFGVLHHVAKPDQMVAEMLRVSKRAIFISDSNNFGQGSLVTRAIKHFINGLGLWKAYQYVLTKGKMYQMSEGDGLAYSYSVFNDYNLIASKCRKVHLLNTRDGQANFYKTASTIALLGIR
jgi:ubiquinone/menaquinone biosynthesis C-methylase UbiE